MRKVFTKSAHCPSCESPLKFASATLFNYWHCGTQLPIANTSLGAAFLLHTTCKNRQTGKVSPDPDEINWLSGSDGNERVNDNFFGSPPFTISTLWLPLIDESEKFIPPVGIVLSLSWGIQKELFLTLGIIFFYSMNKNLLWNWPFNVRVHEDNTKKRVWNNGTESGNTKAKAK